ncbi:T-box protein 2-like [Venturia canescens]|uniref:T-box protein 2-like n=1 Tax=Venturia canescens TaxID=32260 RepID=UPI001C9C49E7|nr:T-box protein 2-like [Venturia canescens]
MNLVSPMDLQMHLHQQMLYTQQQMTLHHHRPEEIAHTNGWLVPPSPGAGPSLPHGVKIELQNKKLWRQFHAESTEMIITKLGRRMFPAVQLNVSGLESRARYCLLLEIAPASRRRHKYVGASGENSSTPGATRGWTSAGPAEPQPRINRRVYLHPDSPATGHHWMQHPVSFGKLKLTNNAVDHHNNVVLTSMHKYIPRIWIIRCDDLANMNNLYSQPSASFTFDETEFIAVTAYQNENITKLKINNNPFAKGFRETGQSRCKRKLHQMNERSESSAEDRSACEEEEENASSSESESHRPRRSSESEGNRPRRALSEAGSLDDSGVSSSGGSTPPLAHSPGNYTRSPLRTQENERRSESAQQPARLHRPWADSSSPTQHIHHRVQESPLAAPSATHPALDFHLFNPFLLPSSHQHHLAALEIARFQHQMQQHRYASQHLAKFYR